MRGFWTCQRRHGGVKCGQQNPNRRKLCVLCGKPRPKRRRPAHMKALDIPYAAYVALFGEKCGICGQPPSPGKRLRRDHDHKSDGSPRGLLCWHHNRALQMFGDSPALLRAAASYLERGENT